METMLYNNPGKDGYHFYLPSGLYAITVNLAVVIATQLVFNLVGGAFSNDTTRTFDTVRGNPNGDPLSNSEWMQKKRLTAETINNEILGKWHVHATGECANLPTCVEQHRADMAVCCTAQNRWHYRSPGHPPWKNHDGVCDGCHRAWSSVVHPRFGFNFEVTYFCFIIYYDCVLQQ